MENRPGGDGESQGYSRPVEAGGQFPASGGEAGFGSLLCLIKNRSPRSGDYGSGIVDSSDWQARSVSLPLEVHEVKQRLCPAK